MRFTKNRVGVIVIKSSLPNINGLIAHDAKPMALTVTVFFYGILLRYCALNAKMSSCAATKLSATFF